MTDIYLPSCKISSPPALAKATLWLMLYWYRLLDFIFHNVDFQLPILHSTILHTPFSSHHIPCFILSCVFVLTLICRPNVRFWTRNASKLTVSIACRRRSGCIVYWSIIRAISVVRDLTFEWEFAALLITRAPLPLLPKALKYERYGFDPCQFLSAHCLWCLRYLRMSLVQRIESMKIANSQWALIF